MMNYFEVNNGVYKAGFARSQEAYNKAVIGVFKKFDELEERLEHSRYLFGDKITESDVRLYVTLARFDIAYYNGFKVNLKTLKEYKNLWAYARDLYQTPGFGDTTNFDAIKKHYHLCCVPNPYKILPLGPNLDEWNSEHNRDKRIYK
ncbi:MAG: glutathione S-transferase family protein [Acholeplasmatales bacterium]|nr:glutathione S-transferase family protein [Acholeplasmatales bacterium]